MKSVQYIEKKIDCHLQEFTDENEFTKILNYAIFPAGKLFRPSLIYGLSHDTNSHNDNHEYFASSIEIHHSYTLIHDDLPAMDNDEYRRGKLSTHKKYGHWQAILAGDALLSLSYGLLSKINHKAINELIYLYHEFTGTRGLILGQVLDLNNKVDNLNDIIQIHTLKTARLIQLSLMGSNILSDKPIDLKEIEKLGLSIGIVFQLIDDLTELTEKVGEHEKEINPFLRFNSNTIIEIINKEILLMRNILLKNELKNLEMICEGYLKKMKQRLVNSSEKIKLYLPEFNSKLINF